MKKNLFWKILLIILNIQVFGVGVILNNDLLGLDDDVVAMVSSIDN